MKIKSNFFLLVQPIYIIVLYPIFKNNQKYFSKKILKEFSWTWKFTSCCGQGSRWRTKGLTHIFKRVEVWGECIAATSILMALAYSFFQLIKKSDRSGQNKFKEQGLVGKDRQKIRAYAAIISLRIVLIRASWQLPDLDWNKSCCWSLMPFQQFLWGLVHAFKAALKNQVKREEYPVLLKKGRGKGTIIKIIASFLDFAKNIADSCNFQLDAWWDFNWWRG